MRQWKIGAIATTACVALGMGVVPAFGQTGQTGVNPHPSGSSAMNHYPPIRYSGGPSIAKRAATSAYPHTFGENNGRWANLPGGYVEYRVPAYKSYLFNVAFSAECRLVDRDKDKYPDKKYYEDGLLIRVTADGRPLQPYDGNQVFCSADKYATHKGNWVYKLDGGHYGTTYRIQVQFSVYDVGRKDRLYGYIDDWTLEAVIYDGGY